MSGDDDEQAVERDRSDGEALILRASDALQTPLVRLLNEPGSLWARSPHVQAHALVELLVGVVLPVKHDAVHVQFWLRQLDGARARLLDEIAPPPTSATPH